MFNPIKYVKDKFKEVVVENLTKKFLGYLKDSIVIIRGYRSIYAVVLLSLQIAAKKVTNPDVGGVIDIVTTSLTETGEGLANGDLTNMVEADELTMALNAVYLIYTVAMKIIKKIRGLPQVPNIVVEKKI